MPLQQGAFGSTFVPNFAPDQSIVPDLGGMFNLRIDPTWSQYYQWIQSVANPIIGAQLNFTFGDFDDGITEDAEPQYAETPILGRPESFMTYTGTSNRTVNFTFQFLAQGLGANSYFQALANEVEAPARWLDSLKFPFVDDSGISHAPPPCIITFGQLLIMRVIVKQATLKWMPGWDTQTMKAHVAELACSFVSVTPRMGNYQATGPTRFAGFTPVGNPSAFSQNQGGSPLTLGGPGM